MFLEHGHGRAKSVSDVKFLREVSSFKEDNEGVR